MPPLSGREGHLGFSGGIPDSAVRNLSIGFILLKCRDKAATDPKDKVLALHGLLKELDIDVSRPDYAKSVADIYTEITATAIEFDKSFFLLNIVPSDKRREDLPSWVPGFSDPF